MGAQTNSGRLSLSSSVFADRVKKFDTYAPSERTQRKPDQMMRSAEPDQLGSKLVHDHAVRRQQNTVQSVKSGVVQPVAIKPAISKSLKPSKQVPNPENLQSVHTLAMQAVTRTPANYKSVIADQFQDMDSRPLKNNKQKKSKLQTFVYTAAVAVFMFASTVSLQTLLTNQQTQEVLADKAEQTQTLDPQGALQGTGDNPAEEPISDDAIINYQVAPELPRYLKIPDIGLFARIKHTGITSEGAVDAPASIHDVSWFNDSAKPGSSSGSSLLLGHVQGWSAPGVFKNINKLETGNRFTVEKGSGETITYEVTSSKEIPLEDVNMARILSEEKSGEHDLKLMTCAGDFDTDTESYLSRYVVYAKIIR